MDGTAPNGMTTLPSSRPVAQTAVHLSALLAHAGVRTYAKVETRRRHTLRLAYGDPPFEILVWEDDAGQCRIGYDREAVPAEIPASLGPLVWKAAGNRT